MKIFYTLLILMSLCFMEASAQYSPVTNGSPQSLLLTETRIDRPLQMHKKQLQANFSYGFLVNTGLFDGSGSKIDYQKQGLASTTNHFILDLHYGLFEFLEFNMNLAYMGTVARSRDLIVLGTTDVTEFTSLTEQKGLEDLRFGFALRPFTKKSMFDLSARLNLSLPTAKYSNVSPAHQISFPMAGYTKIDYIYSRKNGKGMSFVSTGLDAKLRLNALAFSLSLQSSNGLGTSTLTSWNSLLSGSNFIYTSTKSPMRFPDELSGLFLADVKVFSWFDLYGGINYARESGGWQEISNIKYNIPESSHSELILGFEILTTVHLRILEQAELSLSGSNADAFTSIYTTLSYNLFTGK